MNDAQKQAAEYAEVLLAFSRGEPVQAKAENGGWANVFVPSWDFHACQYRVAPKPAEAWVWVYESGMIGSTTWATKDRLELNHLGTSNGKPVLMREVIE